MSALTNVHELHGAEQFYQRWSGDVFALCRLFLGDDYQAEKVMLRTFLAFYHEARELRVDGELSPDLVRIALREMPCTTGARREGPGAQFENCILALQCQQRAVFILRNVLRMGWPVIVQAINLPLEQIRELWLKGMLTVRELLPRDFFER